MPVRNSRPVFIACHVHEDDLGITPPQQGVFFIKMDLPVDESRYDHLLSTNDEPREMEVAEVRKIIAYRQSDLAQLEARIAEVQDMLHSLVERRNQEEQRLSLFRGIVSPIRRLPRDILTEIFLLTREWKPPPTAHGEIHLTPIAPLPMRSPHVITHVCSEWRHVALSTPMLWATIMVDYEDYDSRITSRSPDNDERLHTWLGRTGTYYPLDIAFVGPPRYESIIGAPLSWISSYMHRIKALDLSGIFSGLLTSRFEILEALALANHEWHVGEDKINQTMFPSLRRVVLHEEDELTPPRFIPWPQLTHLSLNADSIVPATLWIMLSQSLELVELHISLDSVGVANGEDDAVVPAINDPVILPHLDTLSVYGDIEWVLENLTLPHHSGHCTSPQDHVTLQLPPIPLVILFEVVQVGGTTRFI
ncbi:hypothetical protein Hypma_004105 [Hypsizygus marmoreus]|uniref:Uncharacterized protein n=1 Tax=Hypsizygus marmoreus TaxID=39966 RepID=A0A369K0D7_HYPMA|nr:hypothetical protein Hypma_004105 [Hypsizygus marmoreus]